MTVVREPSVSTTVLEQFGPSYKDHMARICSEQMPHKASAAFAFLISRSSLHTCTCKLECLALKMEHSSLTRVSMVVVTSV